MKSLAHCKLSINVNYSYPALRMGDWFQDPRGLPKSVDAQVLNSW